MKTKRKPLRVGCNCKGQGDLTDTHWSHQSMQVHTSITSCPREGMGVAMGTLGTQSLGSNYHFPLIGSRAP